MNYTERIAQAAREYIEAVHHNDKTRTLGLISKLSWLVQAERYGWDESTLPEEYK